MKTSLTFLKNLSFNQTSYKSYLLLIFLDAVLCGGDHVSWHVPLDLQNSFIQQMLITEDPQLSQTITPFGFVNFVQVN